MKGSPATLGAIQGTAGHGSALKKLDILIDGQSIGSGTDERSSQIAKSEAANQESENKYVKKKNEGKVIAHSKTVKKEDWEKEGLGDEKHPQQVSTNISKGDIKNEKGETTAQHKEVTYTGQDKIDNDNKIKAAKKKENDAKVAEYKKTQANKKKASPTTMRDGKKTKY